ncbi:hypothetical protein JMJ35_008917 [Cladonia borealis]|uniref:ER membrane protein complex subunit 10 n=1 Tax=Cladonia borealis TaxID=184061 RepID=A0AA39QVJ2_9LECA|nr:hypothetical protein JMJ35_008917 [Cladonia borealis]
MYFTLTPLSFLLSLLIPLPALTATSPPPPLQTLTLHHLPSNPTSTPLPLAILTYHPHHPHLSHLQSFTPPPNTTTSSSDAITQVALYRPQTNHLTSSAVATYAFHPPYKGRFRILVDPITGEAVAASYHAWLPKSSSVVEKAKNNKQPGGKGDFDIQTIKSPPPIVFDKPAKAKGKAGATGAGAGAVEPEGEPEEKTFLQKYWWVLLGVAVLAVSGGGGEK